jgi:chemotaxis protein MotB
MLAIAGNAGTIDLTGICCDGGYEYRHRTIWEKEQQRLKDELAAAQKLLADRDREIASLRSGASESSRLASQLSSPQGDLAQSQARTTDLERQLAALQASQAALRAGAGDKDKLAADLASRETASGRFREAVGRSR